MKDIFLASLSRVIVIVAQLAYVKLYSNYLPNYELGLFFFLITVSYSANALVFVPLDYFQQAKLYAFVRNNISLRTLINVNAKCIAWSAVMIVSISIILGLIRSEFGIYAFLAGVLSILVYIGTALKGVLNNLEYRTLVSAALAGEAILKVVVFLLFMTFLPGQAVILVASAILALGIVIVPLAMAAKRLPAYYSGKVEAINALEVVRFSYPISIGAVFNWIQLQGYRMALVPIGLAETVGIYGTISNIGHAGMGAAAAVFGQVFAPKIYKSSGEYTKTYLKHALILVAGILLVTAVLSEFIVVWLTKEEFRPYSLVILYGVIAEAGNFLIGALVVHRSLSAETKRILCASMLGAIGMVCMFVPLYWTGRIDVYSIGLPIVLSQIVVVAYLFHGFGNARASRNDC